MSNDIVRCPRCGQANRAPAVSHGKAVVCGKCKTPLAAGIRGPIVLNDETFDGAIGSGEAVVVDFWAAWCGPCNTIAPLIEAMAAERHDVTFAKLNVDENRRSASAFRISGIPTLVFFRGGEERGRLVGAVGRGQIEQAITRYLAT
ncbi:MAG TPA: thioredoxin [Thermoanaerobaculia bacterium]|nr:thioredoxin [Thermoanaerobaculia bacterium]